MMNRFAIAFDLDTAKMRQDGLSGSEITGIYQQEIPEALAMCGFTAHPQGSLYHTELDEDAIPSLMKMQNVIMEYAPKFCKYLRRAHVFEMALWSDVTDLFSGIASAGPPSAEEELEEQEFS